jgi:NDP-sugar pyrophosphorylase family protein
MDAVILAGGKGTRLKPYTTTLPKPLMPVGEQPIVSIVIGQLKAAGVAKVTLAVNHMAELIMNFFGSGHKFGIQIEYSVEESALGTVGPIKMIDNLPEHFLVMNGDILTDVDYQALFRSHLRHDCALTVAIYQRELPIDFGVMEVDPESRQVVGFREKPTLHLDVSMGVYVFSRSALDRVPRGRPYGFDNLVLDMLEHGDRINTYSHCGYWLDLGRPDDYDQANQDIELLLLKGAPTRNGCAAGH